MSFNPDDSTLAGSSDVNLSNPQDTEVLEYDSGTGKWVNAANPEPPDASPTTKGIVQLTGDLSGTADSPTVPALAGLKDYYDVIYDEINNEWPTPPSSPTPPQGFKWWRFTSRHDSGAVAPQTQSTAGKDWTFLTAVDRWVWRPDVGVDPT